MNEQLKKAIKIAIVAISGVAGIVLLFLAGLLIFLSITNYKPPQSETISMEKQITTDTIPVGKIELYTWNISHCGNGKEMGVSEKTDSYPTQERYERNRDGIIYQLTTLNKLDFILLQEVDKNSKRSYNDNQVERFKASFKEYAASFALNYKVPFIPWPFGRVKGSIESGLLTLSRFQPLEAKRVSYPSVYGWPKQLFKPDYGYLLTRYAVNNGKQLVLIHTQNPILQEDDMMKEDAWALLQSVITEEYSKGNYVIAGGDWSLNPEGYSADTIRDGNEAQAVLPSIPTAFLAEGYSWAFDPKYPSVRETTAPYNKGKTLTTISDFFILSPNIKLLTCNTLNSNFEFSNHQAVGMIVELE